jgi:hypothetical protein
MIKIIYTIGTWLAHGGRPIASKAAGLSRDAGFSIVFGCRNLAEFPVAGRRL